LFALIPELPPLKVFIFVIELPLLNELKAAETAFVFEVQFP
jgi:hypothetical protein